MKKYNVQFSLLILGSVLFLTAFKQFERNELKDNSVNETSKPVGKETHSDNRKTEPKGTVVLELFTSQGCSSCPPADKVLAYYSTQNSDNIIPLSFHVDYWNYIGWNDPFSKEQFSKRQRTYSQQLGTQGNYTPQLVINGKYELVGSQKAKISTLVQNELTLKNKNSISIINADIKDNMITATYQTDAVSSGTTVNVALVKKTEFTSIKRGENKGVQQTNYNIVFDFKSNPLHNDNREAKFKFNSNWKSSDFIIVAYIQNTKTGEIITATKSAIN